MNEVGLPFNGMRRSKQKWVYRYKITRTDANLVLINVKTILPTLLSVDLYIVIGLRVPSGI